MSQERCLRVQILEAPTSGCGSWRHLLWGADPGGTYFGARILYAPSRILQDLNLASRLATALLHACVWSLSLSCLPSCAVLRCRRLAIPKQAPMLHVCNRPIVHNSGKIRNCISKKSKKIVQKSKFQTLQIWNVLSEVGPDIPFSSSGSM